MPVFSTSISVLYANLCLLSVRISMGVIMMIHGLPKLNALMSGGEIKFSDPFAFLGPQISLGIAVFAEVVCAIFIILGLGTRLACIPLIITMAATAFYAQGNDPFAAKEKWILFLLIFTMLAVFGSGRYSIDRLVTKTDLQ